MTFQGYQAAGDREKLSGNAGDARERQNKTRKVNKYGRTRTKDSF